MREAPAARFSIKRAYEPAQVSDGARVLVDRLWPRGVTRREAHLALWLKEIAPSSELRKWFGHDPKRWADFRRRYREELAGSSALVAQLNELADRGHVTLIYSAHDAIHNQARVLAEYLEPAPETKGADPDA
jgi:uncharacterized protein YeaO (DUF488 family)